MLIVVLFLFVYLRLKTINDSMNNPFFSQKTILLLAMLWRIQPSVAQTMTDSCRIDADVADTIAVVTADSVRLFVVVNIETGVPIRDVLVYTDDGQEVHSIWDGTFSLSTGFETLTLSHPRFEKRVMLHGEVSEDTIALISNQFAINEVIIYGQRRDKTKQMNFTMSPVEAQLAQGAQQGFNPIGLLVLGYDAIWGKKMRHRKEMEKQKRKMILDNY